MYRKIQTPADICPACERYIGEAAVCPYCDADTKQGPRLRKFRLLAIIMIVIGASGMLLLDDPPPPGFTSIGSIDLASPRRNVHITGRVLRQPYMVKQEDRITYLSFMLEDDTGLIRVQVDEQTAQALRVNDALPWEGSALNARGHLKLSPDGKIKMRVTRTEDIEYLTRKVAR